MSCPCGSKEKYSNCCELYHINKKIAPTAQAVMRARYSAYVKNKIDYIEQTHIASRRDNLNMEETKKWAEESVWLGLNIINTIDGLENDSEGKVEFIAQFSQNSMIYEHHELSHFAKIDGQWFYDWGRVSNESKSESSLKEVGRNEPCPCESGKKYKKCCGK